MLTCSELVTGYDDFGKIIFLQSQCRRRCTKNDQPNAEPCRGCHQRLTRFVSVSRIAEPEQDNFSDVSRLMSSLLENIHDRAGHYYRPR